MRGHEPYYTTSSQVSHLFYRPMRPKVDDPERKPDIVMQVRYLLTVYEYYIHLTEIRRCP